MSNQPHGATPIRSPSMEESIRAVLQALELSDVTNVILETPRRFVNYLLEFRRPQTEEQLQEILKADFETRSYDQMIVQSNIPLRGICEHHLLPFIGYADIGYVPNKAVVGLSKMMRLVDAISHERPSLQEHITQRILNVFQKFVEPAGTIVRLRAMHTCMVARGVKASPEVYTYTSALSGVFIHNPNAKAEFFEQCRNQKS